MSAARLLREGFLEMVVPNGVPNDKSWPGVGGRHVERAFHTKGS